MKTVYLSSSFSLSLSLGIVIWSCSDICPVVHIEIDQTIIEEISSVFKSSSSPRLSDQTSRHMRRQGEEEENLIKQSEWATFRRSFTDLYQHETKQSSNEYFSSTKDRIFACAGVNLLTMNR